VCELYGVGFTGSRWWWLVLIHQLILLPCLFVYAIPNSLGHFLAIPLFLALQFPLLMVRTRVPEPVIPEVQTDRKTQMLVRLQFLSLMGVGRFESCMFTHQSGLSLFSC